jgi:hypothetical protein
VIKFGSTRNSKVRIALELRFDINFLNKKRIILALVNIIKGV